MTKTVIALLALVTAAVTFDGGTVFALKGMNGPGTHQAVIVNNKTGKRHEYQRKLWGSQEQCDSAIAGLNARLASITKLDPNDQFAVATPAPDADPVLAASLDQLVVYIVMNTGVVPNFSIACELKADPA